MLHFATELKVITLLLYNQKLLSNNNFLESQIISGGSWLSHMQMDWLQALEGVATYTSGLWISGPALSKQSSSSCFWYTDGLHPVKDLLLSTEGGLKMSVKFLRGTKMLWNRLFSKERSCCLALG